VFPVVVYAGGDTFAIIERSGDAEVRSPGSARPARIFSVGTAGDVVSLAADPNGTILAVGHATGTVALSSLPDGRPLRPLATHTAAVEGVTFSPDGQLIASLGDDNTVNVTNLATHRLLGRLTGHTGAVTAAAFSKDDRKLYTASTDGSVIGWDLANLNNLGTQLSPPGSGQVDWMAASPAGDIAIEYANGDVRLWASGNAAPTRPIHVADHALIGGAFSPDGRLFATSDLAGTVRLVDVRSQRVTAALANLSAPAWAVAFSPDGRRVAFAGGGDAGQLYYFDAASMRQLGPALPLLDHPRQLVWSPDSRNVVVTEIGNDEPGFEHGYVVAYSAGPDVEQWRHHATYASFGGLAWSPDGTTIATGGDATTGIQLLRASDGTLLGGWKDHTLTYTVAYSPDGSIVASTGFDGTVALRDVTSGNRIGPALAASYHQQPSIVTFDAAGHLIISTQDGGLWRWNIDLPYLLHKACAIAGRNLTTQEWADLHTGRPYVAACG